MYTEKSLQYCLDDAWELYKNLVLASVSKTSQKTEIGRWENHIIQAIPGDKTIESITPLDYLTLRRSVELKGLSPQTVHHCLSLLQRVLFRAYEWQYCSKKPSGFKNVFPKFDNKRVRFLSQEEAKRLLNIIKRKYNNGNLYDIVLFALNTGLRKGEILKLNINDINFKHKFISILDTKSTKNRVLPLNDIVINLLKKRVKESENYFIFGRFESKKFSLAIKETEFNIGITDLRHKVVFHTLRHTFASWLVQDGFPLILVSELLGHSNINMTMRYAHLAPHQGKKAVFGIEKRFKYIKQ